MQSIIALIIYLLPLILYFVFFKDSGAKQIIWAIVVFLFSWIGLLVRWIVGVLGKE